MISQERQEILPPKETLKKLGLKKGATVADIGAGIGYFSLPAAQIVGSEGLVYALDTSEEMLGALEEIVKEEGLANLKLVKSSEYDAQLEDAVDFILISSVIHEVEDKQQFFANYLDKLKLDGALAIIEWKKEEMESGPPLEIRVSTEELAEILSQFGMKIVKELALNDQQYAILSERN
ncbi:class I SAM-dependent methyltransferase [Fuchsiella alkaliacetigena]|uniref:class I SAM-dependent methyltransferase n=1 Tax=Fuchsiella alkaliacetigena TaxID=957042 RepID=UPI00200B6EF2|nr:methyltransferase domain-containing protein [Fuchsiella alkaliacetigena]MCK8823640.1 methyltransferase domain-containing protein [Fuchsiella alkaliacetigena]